MLLKTFIQIFVLVKPFVLDITIISTKFRFWINLELCVNTIKLLIVIFWVLKLTISPVFHDIKTNFVEALVPLIQLRDQWEER